MNAKWSMKMMVSLLLLFSVMPLWSQKETQTSEAFTVSGQVRAEATFTVAAIEKLPSQIIPDATITNHLGEKKSDAKQMKGVLIKELLKDVVFISESPKDLSELYFTFIAGDGYKVVYSWNEIYNSATGDHLFLVTEKEGEKLAEMKSRILTFTPTDFKTGRRYIKGLVKIVVSRTE